MDPDSEGGGLRWPQIDSALNHLLGLDSVEERQIALEELGARDPELRRQVMELLAAAEVEDVLDLPVAEVVPDLVEGLDGSVREADSAESVDRTIDRYRLIEILGRGGMGVVYLAQRADELFDRRVAIKLLPRGLESPERQHRFAIERQILARLEHPGIAQLHDGGLTDEGFPYLVMEYVEGDPIDVYCREQRLDIPQRLRLFIEVCEAVQYAHRNLVVHRDLKPNNILVTIDGRSKLLDFGVGKILEETEGEQKTVVQPMTPDYASPEQIENQPVSTATDIYSLGVLLFQLLTDRRPYRLAGLSLTEIVGVVGRRQIQPPSKMIGDDEGGAETRRAEDIRRWRRSLQGDLDNIVLKCLRKRPERRYGSAGELAEDVRRHLAGLPVDAQPSTWRYRAGKFIRRHRLGVAASAAVAVLLVIGAVTIVWQGRVASRERDHAREEANRAQRVADFLAGLFEAASPTSEAAGTLSARDLLDQGEIRIRQELGNELAVRGEMLSVMSGAYSSLGDYEKALDLAQSAVDDLRQQESADRLGLARALTAVASVRLTRGEYETVESPLAEALSLALKADSSPTKEAARIYLTMGLLKAQTGNPEGAVVDHRQALQLLEEVGSIEEKAVQTTHLAGTLDTLNRRAEALALKLQALQALIGVHGEEHPLVLSTQNNIAYSFHNQGRLQEAETIYRQVLEISERQLGPDHAEVANHLTNLGKALIDQRRYREAEPYVRRAVTIRQQTVDENQFYRIAAEINLASLETELGQIDSAIVGYRSALDRFERLVGAEHPATARVQSLLGQALHRHLKLAESEELLRSALVVQRQGEPNLNLADSLIALGAVLVDSQRAVESIELLRQGLELRSAELPEQHWLIAEARVELAGALLQLGSLHEAKVLLTSAEKILEPESESGDWISGRATAIRARLENVAHNSTTTEAGAS